MMQSNNKPHSKPAKRVSKSGRIIKTPKAILTTSSDEGPRQRSSKKQVHVRTEVQRLREIAKKLLENKKNSVSENEVMAPAVIKESFPDLPVKNVVISTNIEQANSKETRQSGNKSPPPEYSGLQIAKPKKATNTASSISESNCCGISPSPPRNELPNVEVNTEREYPMSDLEENREKVSKVDFNLVLESVQRIVEQNQEMKLQFETITKQNLEIIAQQKEILDGVRQRNINEEVSEKLYEPLQGFPLKTIEQFKELEVDSKKSIRKKLYVHLCNLGGTKVREFLSSALKEVMSDELVNSFTWPGGKKTVKLGNTKVANILYLAARKCPLFRGPDTKAEFKMDMLEVLRTTKQRFRNILKKVQVTDQVDKTDDDELDELDDEQLLQKIRRLEERLNMHSEVEDVDREMEEDFDADYDTDDH